MASTQKIESIKKWTPWIASAVVVVFSLLIFWGVINFVMKFLGADSYFSVAPSGDVLTSASIKERNEEMSQFLKERSQKRQEASVSRSLGDGEKDPFNLP